MHTSVLPRPTEVTEPAGCIGNDREGAGETDLSAMGMTTEVQVDSGLFRLGNDFRGVGQQHREGITAPLPDSPGQAVGTVEVRVIHSGTKMSCSRRTSVSAKRTRSSRKI